MDTWPPWTGALPWGTLRPFKTGFRRLPMPAPRFYCDISLQSDCRLLLPEAVAHHATRVLRLPDGAAVTLFDGRGGEFPATLQIEARQVFAQIGAHCPREAELGGHITLVQGLPSGDKMDWIVEKCVELGVSRIVTISATRSVLQLSGPRLEKRLAHWQRIARSACEQCGRNRIPEIEPPQSLKNWLVRPFEFARLLGDPQAEQGLGQWLTDHAGLAGLAVLVGPEGGWSEEERDLAHAAGVQGVLLGSRVLRTETAGLAMVASISALAGW